MTTIELEFLASRYHGTNWGRHVNEGVPEWPPSPYRLIRALYDVWKRKCSHVPEAQVRDLFAALASELPDFYLPQAVSAHTRSYLSGNSFDPSDKNLVFDAFLSVARNSRCWMEWRTELTVEQRSLLEELLAGLNYLGRSESWIAARLGTRSGGYPCRPLPPGPKDEGTYVACPIGAHEYRGKRKWLDAIAYSSSEVLKEKLSGPPAMRSVLYSMERGALATWLPSWRKPGGRVSAAVLDLHAPVLPRITDAVWIAERFRGRLMRYFENRGLPIPPLVHGKGKDGRPSTSHKQLFILPQADKLGRIDSLYILTKHEDGFDADNASLRDAIAAVKGLAWMDEIRLTPVWTGSAGDRTFRKPSRIVTSFTPFVTIRHWRKGRGTFDEFMKREVLRECEHHGLPRPRVEPMELACGIHPVKFRKYRGGDPSRPGFSFRLEFDEPVPSPFSLGYACHFGLGQFRAEA